MFARLKSPLALAALAAVSAALAVSGPSASRTRAPEAGAPHPGAAGIEIATPMQGPTAFGFLEFDWNGAVPGFSPWRGDATTADLFPQRANATE
jgi:hypothetical protein